MDRKSLSHTRWQCQYHIVFIPKYGKKKLYGQVKRDVREILSTLCKYKGVEIIEGAVCIDHVHMCVSIPPKLSVSNFMGYFVSTIGNVNEETIKKYIREQETDSQKEDKDSGAF